MRGIPGRWVSLSLPRRFICDLLYVSRHIPVVTFERQVDISPVIAARKKLKQPPAWAVLFAKGFAIVAARRPELRRTYLPYPWPHLWEGKVSIAAIAVEREFQGEQGVFFGMLKASDEKPLAELHAKVLEWKTHPVEKIAFFRRILGYSRRPLLIRRFIWWCAVSWFGTIKTRNFGTFGVSLTGAAGATATNLIGPVTTALNCGVIRANGTVDLRLHFDHRVLDGMLIARALAELEEVLKNEIVEELEAIANAEAQVSVRNRAGDPLFAGNA